MKQKIEKYLKLDTLKNIFWLFGDKILRLGVGLIVGVLVARYLGPELFGKWNYAIAFISLVSALATLGLDQLIVKHLLHQEQDESTILGTAFSLRLVGSFISTIIVIVYFSLFKNDIELLIIATLTVLNLWFQTLDVIDLKNQSVLQSKKTVVVKNLAFLVTSLLRISFIYFNFSLITFVLLALFEYVLAAFGLIAFYGVKNVVKWRFDNVYCLRLLRESWPLILSGIVIMMYMRLDQIMIGEMLGEKSVGLYSVSVRFTEFFYFIPSIFMTSLFPNLVQKFSEDKNKYYMDYLRLMRLLFTLAISIGIFFTFFGDFLISYLYGNQFLAAIDSLKLSIFTGVFVFWGVAAGNMLIIEGLNRHNFIKSVQGLILNILLNFLLIPKYGINGAAFATLISQFYASYLYYLFFRKTRHIFMLQTKSILFIKLCTK